MSDTKQSMTRARARIEADPHLADFSPGADDDHIAQAALLLSVTFPLSYRQFLRDYGAGDFNGAEFYGILIKNFPGNAIPCVIWITQDQRRQVDMPAQFVIVAHAGDGPWYCIDTSVKGPDGESPVCLCSPTGRKMQDTHPSFAAFFEALVTET